MQQYLQNKKGLVQNVFDQVYDQYDLMNDFMSLGIHRLWKKSLLNMMNPSQNQNLIDVACGKGDIAKLFLNYVNKKSKITCVDPIKHMVSKVKAGTIIIEDTRGLHKAGIPKKAYRDLGFAVFLPPNMFRKSRPLYHIYQSAFDHLTEEQKLFIPPSNIVNG